MCLGPSAVAVMKGKLGEEKSVNKNEERGWGGEETRSETPHIPNTCLSQG